MKKHRLLIAVAVALTVMTVAFLLIAPAWSHNRKWVHLPFKSCDPQSIPAAKTPDGTPLTLAAVAGDYWYTAGHSGFVRISAEGKCWCHWGGSLWAASSKAVARIVDGRVELESLNLLGFRNGETCVCIPVWWQDRVYLLGCPESDYSAGGVAQFCNAINWGEEPGHGFRHQDLVYMSGSREPATGTRLGIPESIKNMILRAPLDGKIISNSPVLRANLGKRDGLYLGMRLFAPREDGYARWLRVSGLEEETCTLRPYHDDSDQPVPKVGTAIHCDAKGADFLSGK